MTPIFFEGRFGWLHDAAPATPARCDGPARLGVVLCAAFAQEEVCSHYGLMLLADRLAAAGLPTIRFDYRGTGDSDDIDVMLNTLCDDVARAVDCLRQQCGVGPVALCGLRLGAAIAVRAANEIAGVAGLALLAPVVSGRAFLRETRAAASVSSLALLDPVPKADAGQALNTNGFVWNGALQQQIAALDLTPPAPHVPQALLMATRSDRHSAAFVAALRATDTIVTEAPFVDYDGYMQDPTTHQPPLATFARVVEWLADIPVAVTPVQAGRAVPVRPTLALDRCEEVPVRFGPDERVFGMLCRPVGQAAASIAALLLHEGSSHHIGNGRAYVTLARRLARVGIASLRMDLTGMGDSPAGSPRSPYYDPERMPEVLAGIDWLDRAGYPHIATFGLCSGADAAYKAALADERVVAMFIINLQKFIWNYGDDLRIVQRNSKRTLRSYARSLRNPGEWRRALSGKADLIGIVRVLAKRGVARGVDAVRGLFPPAADSEIAIVRGQMRALADRGVETRLIFSDEDPGLGEMTRHFGGGAQRLRDFAGARMPILDKADHHFNGSDVRRRYQALVEAEMTDLARRYAPAAAPVVAAVPVVAPALRRRA